MLEKDSCPAARAPGTGPLVAVACAVPTGSDASNPSPPDPADRAVQQAIGIIGRRYAEPLSLLELACEVGVSRYRLSHRFSRFVGMPLREYLLTVRLEKAKELLADGRISITVVAQDVGFGDLPRFDKLFRRYTGITPSAFRVRSAGMTRDKERSTAKRAAATNY